MKGQEGNGEGTNISLPSNIGRIWKEEKIDLKCVKYKVMFKILNYTPTIVVNPG